jgi:hypothetical protein
MNPKEGLAFRSSFWQSYLWALSYTILIGITPPIIIESGHTYLLAVGGGLLAGTAWVTLFTALAVYFFKARLYPEGFRGYNLWGAYRSTTWSDMVRVKKTNVGGLQYLRVYTKDSTYPLWLPLFLKGMPLFRDRVKEFAPADNPLAIYFEEEIGHATKTSSRLLKWSGFVLGVPFYAMWVYGSSGYSRYWSNLQGLISGNCFNRAAVEQFYLQTLCLIVLLVLSILAFAFVLMALSRNFSSTLPVLSTDIVYFAIFLICVKTFLLGLHASTVLAEIKSILPSCDAGYRLPYFPWGSSYDGLALPMMAIIASMAASLDGWKVKSPAVWSMFAATAAASASFSRVHAIYGHAKFVLYLLSLVFFTVWALDKGNEPLPSADKDDSVIKETKAASKPCR